MSPIDNDTQNRLDKINDRLQKELDDIWNAINDIRNNGTKASNGNSTKIDNLNQNLEHYQKREEKHNNEKNVLIENIFKRFEGVEAMYHALDKDNSIAHKDLITDMRKGVREENNRMLGYIFTFFGLLSAVVFGILRFL